jgi:hypothetical protein
VCATVAQGGEVTSLTGTVAVETLHGRQLLVAVDTANEGRDRDGVIDHLFRFSLETPLAEPISLAFEQATVEVHGGVLRLSAPEAERVLLLAVGGALPPGERVGRPGRDQSAPGGTNRPARYRIALVHGIELATYFGLPALRLDDFLRDPAGGPHAVFMADDIGDVPGGDVDHDDTSSGSSGGGCTAGGPGSTSCSVTCGDRPGCSVSCASGYYACCKCGSYISAPSCTCKRP